MHKTIYNFFHRHYHLKYHGTYKQAKKLFIFDLALLGLAILMFSASLFFYFWKPGITDLVDLSVSLGTDRIKSGEPVTVYLDYGNRSKFKLENISLSLRLPNGFIINRQKTPENVFPDNSLINVQKLDPGEKGHVEIYGDLWTNISTEEKIIALITYQPENTDRKEQKLATMLVNLPESVLSGILTIPQSTYPNNKLPFTLTLKNSGEKTIEEIRLSHSWSGLVETEENLETFKIEPRQEKIITGTVETPNKSGDIVWTIYTQVVKNNRVFSQLASSEKINIFLPKIYTRATLKNSPAYAEPGMDLPLEIYYKNNSAVSIKNLKIKIAVNAGIVDINATAKANNLKIVNGELMADGENRTALSNSQPGKDDYFTINLKLLNSFALNNLEKASLNISPLAIVELPGSPNQKIEQFGEAVSIRLATELKVVPEVRYYTIEGDQLGRGPLPPKVGETTKYWIFVKITNTSNDVSRVNFSTKLPVGVEFTGRQSVTIGPPLIFDNKNRSISWSYKELPANSQTGLYFETAVTPTMEQLNKNLSLTEEIFFSAVDTFIGKNFNFKFNGLNNVLNKNDQGSQYGSKCTL